MIKDVNILAGDMIPLHGDWYCIDITDPDKEDPIINIVRAVGAVRYGIDNVNYISPIFQDFSDRWPMFDDLVIGHVNYPGNRCYGPLTKRQTEAAIKELREEFPGVKIDDGTGEFIIWRSKK